MFLNRPIQYLTYLDQEPICTFSPDGSTTLHTLNILESENSIIFTQISGRTIGTWVFLNNGELHEAIEVIKPKLGIQ